MKPMKKHSKLNLKRLVFLLVASTQISDVCIAGERVGNGADVVVCENEPSNRLRLLDLYERDALFRFKPLLLDSGALDPVSLAKEVLQKQLKNLDPSRLDLYSSWIESFFLESLDSDQAQLTDIEDSGILIVPRDCFVTQLVIQRKPIFGDDPRYLINDQLFKDLTIEHQAAVLVHEAVYREVIPNSPTSSVNVRAFTALIFSARLSDMTQDVYDKFLRSRGFEVHQ